MSEEIGCVGSAKADLEFFKDTLYILQCDRRGNNDFITNISGEISSKEFQDDVKPIIEAHGYRFFNGMTTDVGKLTSREVGVSTANMSCGYYNPHCDDDVINLYDVDNTMEMFRSIMTAFTKQYVFVRPPYVYPVYTGKTPKYSKGHYNKNNYGGYYNKDSYGGWDDEWDTGGYDSTYEKSKVADDTKILSWDELWNGEGVANEDLYKHFLMVYSGYEPKGGGIYTLQGKKGTYFYKLNEMSVYSLSKDMAQLAINSAWDEAQVVREERRYSERVVDVQEEEDVDDKTIIDSYKLETCWGCSNTFPKDMINGTLELCHDCTALYYPKK
jgi:hypothetical protein